MLRTLSILAVLALAYSQNPIPEECIKPNSGLLGSNEINSEQPDLEACAQACRDAVPPPELEGWTCASFNYFAEEQQCFLSKLDSSDDSFAESEVAFPGTQFVDLACVDGAATTPAPGPTAEEFAALSDADKAAVCCFWAKVGECDKNPFFMRPNCQAQCGTQGCTVETAMDCAVTVDQNCDKAGATPGSGCKEVEPVKCPTWAGQGECDKNPYWMKLFCQQSCQTCGMTMEALDASFKDPACPDADKNALCGYWASTNECTSNPGWMAANCASSCKKCNAATAAPAVAVPAAHATAAPVAHVPAPANPAPYRRF